MMNEKRTLRLGWLLTIAWRDSKKSRAKLLLFTSSIVLGIAALVAIHSFSFNLRDQINAEARELIGADLAIRSREAIADSMLVFLDTLNLGEKASEISFASMALFPKTDGTRLVQIKALEGNFPFYGDITTQPADRARTFQQGKFALVDQSLLFQFGSQPGDSIQVGNVTFQIAAQVDKAPGEVGLSATVAPTVYIPAAYLKETGLLQRGSRVNYTYYYQLEPGTDLDALETSLKPILKSASMSYETVAMRKESVGKTFSDLSGFLNLVGFVALLLGCVGVASAVHMYVKEKLATVAVLRCLGMTGTQAFLVFLLQIATMGLIGAIAGVILGSSVQWALPEVLKDFLPVEVGVQLSWKAALQGLLTGACIAVLFALLPLLQIRGTSPLLTLRASFDEGKQTPDPLRWLVFAGIFAFILGFAWLQLEKIKEALIFTIALTVIFALLTGVAYAAMYLFRRFFPSSWNYVWRQGMANLFRPNNQTLILIVSIGLGTSLIATLFFIQGLLLEKVSLSAGENQPNTVLFDIQTPQKEQVANLIRARQLPVIQEVPVVTMKLARINGSDRIQNSLDSLSEIPEFAFTREYRVTYRDTLISSEKVTSGTWMGPAKGNAASISLEEGYAKRIGVALGDRLTFDVQGAPLQTVVTSLREVDWNRVQTNFLVVFPQGVLEQAPQFHVMLTRVKDPQVAAKLQSDIVSAYPNISVIDLGLILRTLDEVLGKVAFVIRFMALFSIVTGLIVLAGAVIISKYQRIQESVLLRTLGANRRQVLKINALEYFFLGSLASLSGVMLSLVSSWALATFSFEAPFLPDLLPAFLLFCTITGLTMLIGIFNSQGILQKPPLEVLRSET
jgi:putative ABC transport system permease protein